ncbi:MAG: replication and repair protein RecF [Actinomycetota bacterium]|nr:replication and repair protein RecF [Actinomycetota bacterium]
MHLTHLSLADFRSYEAVEVPLTRGVSTFVGSNGQGKTNLVEAVGYLAHHSSHRVPTDAPLIRRGRERAVVRGSVERAGRTTLIELQIVSGAANRVRVNRSPTTRPRDALGLLRTVLFAPEDLVLVRGEPEGRRRFLDDLLVSRAPRFAGIRSDYDRALRQRNALLRSAAAAQRSGRADLRTLDVWDGHVAASGAELVAGRIHLIRKISPHVLQAYATLSACDAEPRLSYRCTVGEAIGQDGTPSRQELHELLLQGLAAVRRQELERGLTLIGPHRDDLVIGLGDMPAKGFASHGECWSLALALRLAGYELLRADPGPDGDGEPVLILDDVFAELDTGRRARLTELISQADQVLITAAVPQDVPSCLAGASFTVDGGQVLRDA